MSTSIPAPLPVLDLSGTPREVGRAQGEALRGAIQHNVALYLDRFRREAGVDPDTVKARGLRYLRVIEQRCPPYAEMVHGAAEGSGRALDEIAALNARYEILYSAFSLQAQQAARPGGGGECTAFAVLPEATRDGHLFLGQNWDWMSGVRGALLRVRHPNGLAALSFTEAGIVGGKIGLNSAGLGLAINGLYSEQDSWERLRLPFHVRTWAALKCQTLDEARRVILGEERSCSANFLLAQADGERSSVENVETAPFSERSLDAEEGVLVHANHFQQPDRLGVSPVLDPRSTSHFRCGRLDALIRERRGSLDAHVLAELLADHEDYPHSVCAHPSPLWPADEPYQTVFSTVMDLHTLEMWASPGNPCLTSFQRVSLRA